MRFEGKHAYFKDLAKKIKNFKNIPYLLAQKNQKVVCAEHMSMAMARSVHCLITKLHSEKTRVYLVEIWRRQKPLLLDFFQ